VSLHSGDVIDVPAGVLDNHTEPRIPVWLGALLLAPISIGAWNVEGQNDHVMCAVCCRCAAGIWRWSVIQKKRRRWHPRATQCCRSGWFFCLGLCGKGFALHVEGVECIHGEGAACVQLLQLQSAHT
jgi:hypothetical protein